MAAVSESVFELKKNHLRNFIVPRVTRPWSIKCSEGWAKEVDRPGKDSERLGGIASGHGL